MTTKSILEQNLIFPDAPDFVSTPPQYSVAEMIRLCEALLPYWNKIRYSKPEPEFVGPAFSLYPSLKDTEPST